MTTNPLTIDPQDFLVAAEMIRREHGDAAVIGEPYLDKHDRIFAPVTKNGKYVDEVFLGRAPPANLDNLIGKTVREPDNKAYNDLIVALDAKAKHDANKPAAATVSAPKQPVVASKS